LFLETTGTISDGLVVSEDSEETLFSPASTPGVLENPVVLAGGGASVADDEDTVVEGGAAEVLDDSTEVELHADSGGVDGDGNWSGGDGSLEVGWAVGLDVGEALDGGDSTLGGAGLLFGFVWVVCLRFNFVGFGVLEGVVHETTLAAFVAEGAGAVDELLLGESGEGVSGNLISSFH